MKACVLYRDKKCFAYSSRSNFIGANFSQNLVNSWFRFYHFNGRRIRSGKGCSNREYFSWHFLLGTFQRDTISLVPRYFARDLVDDLNDRHVGSSSRSSFAEQRVKGEKGRRDEKEEEKKKFFM